MKTYHIQDIHETACGYSYNSYRISNDDKASNISQRELADLDYISYTD
jgi:hypothetical protein